MGGAGVNKGLFGLSLSCKKEIQYAEKSRADEKKRKKEMRKRDDVGKKTGHFCSQGMAGLRGAMWAELEEVPAVHALS